MKIKKFRIKNFKSIQDSGQCYLENDLTIFAGKNESGKSSILEALENFNLETEINENVKPIGNKDALPQIILRLILSPEEVNRYYEEVKIDNKTTKELEITVTKQYPNVYTVDNITENLFELKKESSNENGSHLETQIQTIYQEISSIHTQYFTRHTWPFFILNFKDIKKTIIEAELYLNRYRASYIRHISSQSIRNNNQNSIQELLTLLHEFQTHEESRNNNWEIFSKMLPNFILFKSFEDILPNEVPFEELDKSEFIKDLKIISDIDTTLIKSDDKRSKLQHNKRINIHLNKEYSQFWLQDSTEIKIHWDNDILEFWVEENNIPFKPSERSKGKQWHMSFYIKITARAIEEKFNVILVDEPGLYLHATAQNDIYNKLCKLPQNGLFKSRLFLI